MGVVGMRWRSKKMHIETDTDTDTEKPAQVYAWLQTH